MSALILERLPEDVAIESAVLLAPALSQHFDFQRALQQTRQGIWNFYSPMDAIFLIAGTTLFGTLDGKHQPAGGAAGFRPGPEEGADQQQLRQSKLHQISYQLRMSQSVNLGGHFGCVNRLFVEEWIAPILLARNSVPQLSAVGT